jgi:large subunit ribosomal protein L6
MKPSSCTPEASSWRSFISDIMIEYEVEIPKDVEVKIEGNYAIVNGKLGELKWKFDLHQTKHEIKDGVLVLKKDSKRKVDKAIVGSIASHIKNMIRGVTRGYEYKMKILYAHFPINASVEGKRVVIKNFAGEKTPRYAEIYGNVKVDIKGQDIVLKGNDREEVGQTAANIESATKIRKKDVRVFQDGIYITSKDDKHGA